MTRVTVNGQTNPVIMSCYSDLSPPPLYLHIQHTLPKEAFRKYIFDLLNMNLAIPDK